MHQPLSHPKQIRAGECDVGRKIGLEKVKSFMLFTLHSKSATEIAW
jgi:hypothetical protein